DQGPCQLPGGSPCREIYSLAILGSDPNKAGIMQSRTFERFGPGDFRYPTVEPHANRMAFISTNDLLQNGTSGNRLFVMAFNDPNIPLYQLTGRGDVQGPLGFSLNNFLVTATTTDDMDGSGISGQQLFMIDYVLGHYAEPGKGRLTATLPFQAPGEPSPGNPNASCDDGDGCTNDVCAVGGGCQHTPKPDGSSCGGGDQCVGFQTCSAGACVRTGAVTCDDLDVCTVDSCDPSKGCVFTSQPSVERVQCRSRRLINLRRPGVRSFKKAKKVLQQATTERKAKRARKMFIRALHLLDRFMSTIDGNPAYANVRDATQKLIDQINEVIGELGTS